jgi:hypothetical protein
MRPVVENRSQPGPEPAAVETRLRAEQNDRFALARWAVVPPVLLAQPRHEQVSGNVAEYRGRTRHRTPALRRYRTSTEAVRSSRRLGKPAKNGSSASQSGGAKNSSAMPSGSRKLKPKP